MLYSQEGPKGVTTWPLPTFGEVYGRCKPKQKLTSPDADPFVLDHPDGSCKVACRILLFPRGLSDSDESPTLGGVMFKQIDGIGSCTIHFSCNLMLMDGAEVLSEYTDSGECTLDGDDHFSAPTSVEFGYVGSIPPTFSASVVLKCWIKNDDLFGDVRLGFSSIATSMYGFVSQSPAAARPPSDADAVEVVDVPVKIQASSLDDLVTVVLDTPEGWSEDEWAVLVHICAAVVATRDLDASTSEQATLSDGAKGDLFRLCPPLRTHFQELAHAPNLQGVLVKQLVGALQTFSGLDTPTSKAAELHALIEEVGSTNELEEMEMLYRFVLDPSSISAGASKFKEGMLSELSNFKSELVDVADRLDVSNYTSHAELVEGRIRALEDMRDDALTANTTLRDRVRYIIEYAGWGATAVSGLQACLEVPVVSPIEEAVQTGRSLLVLLSK